MSTVTALPRPLSRRRASVQARAAFEKVRSLDEFNLDGMDVYASLVHANGDSLLLNRITHDMLAISESRPEPWNAVALYCDLRGEKAKAVNFIDDPAQVLGEIERFYEPFLVRSAA